MFWVLDHWNGVHLNQVEDYGLSWGRSWLTGHEGDVDSFLVGTIVIQPRLSGTISINQR